MNEKRVHRFNFLCPSMWYRLFTYNKKKVFLILLFCFVFVFGRRRGGLLEVHRAVLVHQLLHLLNSICLCWDRGL
jgi:hypothetical protein